MRKGDSMKFSGVDSDGHGVTSDNDGVPDG
jgi:hypothetical protein